MITFVILHYFGLDDTYRCIDSILDNLKTEQFSVVIVDNNSKDSAGPILKEKYKIYDNIDIVINKENTGFSTGNNIGCRYARKKYDPDFLCVINNDIYIEDSNFIVKILEKYKSENFDVLGPYIWNIKRKFNQNPIKVISTIEEVEIAIERSIFSGKLLDSKVPILYYTYNKFCKSKPRIEEGLHGSALIFSRKYIDKYSEIFPEYTFMYGEENLLFYRKIKDKLVFCYDEQLKVYHNHSSSTSKTTKNIIGKWKFQHKLMHEALLKLKEVYTENERI